MFEYLYNAFLRRYKQKTNLTIWVWWSSVLSYNFRSRCIFSLPLCPADLAVVFSDSVSSWSSENSNLLVHNDNERYLESSFDRFYILSSSVTGNISWWHRFENDNLMILLAVIAGIILMVIIICIIIIIVCRRKRAADKCKYNSESCTEISLVETLYSCDWLVFCLYLFSIKGYTFIYVAFIV